MFSGTASASQVPWQTTARNANVVCLGYDNKIFKLPGLAALQKVKTAKDFTPALLKKSAAPYFAGELALEQDMVRKWSALATPREPAYRVAWARWLTLWKTVRIPAAQKIAASAKQGDLKAFQAAQAPIDARTPRRVRSSRRRRVRGLPVAVATAATAAGRRGSARLAVRREIAERREPRTLVGSRLTVGR